MSISSLKEKSRAANDSPKDKGLSDQHFKTSCSFSAKEIALKSIGLMAHTSYLAPLSKVLDQQSSSEIVVLFAEKTEKEKILIVMKIRKILF